MLKNQALAFSNALKGGALTVRRLQPLRRQSCAVGLKAAAALAPDHVKDDLDRELNGALQYAREVDKKHGLCSEPSQRAWAMVDDIYKKAHHEDGSGEHSSNHSNHGQPYQQMPRRNSRRKVPRPTNRITMTAGSRYYYF